MHVPPLPVRAAPWYLRPFFWNQRRKYGSALDSARLWARAPRLFLGVALLYGMIDRRSSPIAPALRALVTVRVSQIKACSFCVDINSATLLRHGVPLAKVEALPDWRESPAFTDEERAALDFAEAATRTDAQVEARHVAALRAHFDDDGIVELAGLVAFQNMSATFNAALDVPAQGFCPMPGPAAGLPAGRPDRADAG